MLTVQACEHIRVLEAISLEEENKVLIEIEIEACGKSFSQFDDKAFKANFGKWNGSNGLRWVMYAMKGICI